MPSRMTLSIRNNKAVIAGLRQYGEGAKERAKIVVEESADRVYQTSHSLAPVDTGFMVEHLRKVLTPAHLGYQVGFREADFLAAGKEFYPIHVVFGTRYMPGRDFLFAPFEAEKPRFIRELAGALKPR